MDEDLKRSGLQFLTPVEQHEGVWVKREDLSAPFPGPGFSGYRGVYAHIKAREERTIGVLDTRHSKAGWAVAYACQKLGKRCVNFFPIYAAHASTLLVNAFAWEEDSRAATWFRFFHEDKLQPQQRMAKSLGAELCGIRAGGYSVIYRRAEDLLKSNVFRSHAGYGYMMPRALKLPEGVTENAIEASRTNVERFNTVVLPTSFGTVAAGVLKGVAQRYEKIGERRLPLVVIHLSYSRPQEAAVNYIARKAGVSFCGEYDGPNHPGAFPLRFVDQGYSLRDPVVAGKRRDDATFPCSQKAWHWLTANKRSLPNPILFWNTGS